MLQIHKCIKCTMWGNTVCLLLKLIIISPSRINGKKGAARRGRELDGSRITSRRNLCRLWPFRFESSQVVLMQQNEHLLTLSLSGNDLSGSATTQISTATWLEAKEPCRSHGGFKHQSICCILMEINKNPICAKYMLPSLWKSNITTLYRSECFSPGK